MAETISHPTIGTITASTAKDGVIQYLGLQYATLKDRFSPPVMKKYSSGDSVDATKIGPQVLSVAPNGDPEFGLIQHSLEYDRSVFYQSDTEGLCLNMTVPKSGLEKSAKLPVFVFIHGGGFMVGSGMYPQYDLATFVRLSVASGTPCIAVTVNYRLGVPGFLTSSEMQAAGYKANNGLHDQRIALLWLHKHLEGFGGDASNITLAGESAGGVSVCYHLFSEKPLFKRMISMSGTMLLMPPISGQAADDNYRSATKALGLAKGAAIDSFVKMDGAELVGKTTKAGTRNALTFDNDICPTHFDFASIGNDTTSIPGQHWCQAAIIGDCQFDGNIQSLRLMHRKSGIASAFCSSLSKSLASHSGLADRIYSAYGLSTETNHDDALYKVLQIANDLNFYLPTLSLSRNLSQHMDTYVYRFNEPNPWDGPWKGEATHILDLAFLTQNFNEFLDDKQKRVAVQFAEDVIAFVSGKQPWDASSNDKTVAKVLGPHGKMEVVEDVPEKVGRRSVMLELGREVGFDVLNDAFSEFMAPPPPI